MGGGSPIAPATCIEVGVFIADGLRSHTAEERVHIFDTLWDFYCPHCGREQGPKMVRCQCWNDE